MASWVVVVSDCPDMVGAGFGFEHPHHPTVSGHL